MTGLRNCFLACVIFSCSSAAAQSVLVPQIQAVKPDEGTPPAPSEPPSDRAASLQQQLGRIAATFAQRCLACHGPDKQEGNYSLASFAELRSSGDSARQPILAGQPDGSELYRRLVTSETSERMPAESEPLDAQTLAMIRDWIARGAEVPDGLEQQPLRQWPRAPIAGHTAPAHYPAALPIAALALAADAKSIWTSGYGEVIQWELGTGQILSRRPVAGVQIADIEVSRDGQLLAVSSGTPGRQGVVEVWQTGSESTPQPLWSDIASDVAADMAFAPAGARLAIGRFDGSLVQIDLEKLSGPSPSAARNLTPHADAVLCVAWSESGDRLITGSRDRTAKIFDGDTLDLIANYDRHQRAVGGVAYVGARPASFDEAGQLRLWAGDDSDRSLAEQSNLPRFLERLASSGDHIYLADGPDVRVLHIESKETEDGKDDSGKPKTKTTTHWREAERLHSGSSWIMSLTYAHELLAAGTESGEVVVWDKNAAEPKFKFTAKP